MKRIEFTKVIASVLVVGSVFALNSVGASAEWKQDSHGWWNTEGNSYSIGWREINGKLYYFGQDGYMLHDTRIGYYILGSDGALIPSIQNDLTEAEKDKGNSNQTNIQKSDGSKSINNTDVKSQFTLDGVTLKLENSAYVLGTKQIKFYITNNTDEIRVCKADYVVSKFEDDMWHTFSQFTKSDDKSVVINPKDTEEGTISLNVLKGFTQFTPGKYRVTKRIGSEDYTVEFDLKEKLS
ncbi:hypothetical protein B0P06_005457 [Clostridium saccharoperbutylacetonicum]|uniref:Bacterial Ig-like domain-containing protein n=1 Tax=Clostridium saccharoperbutylacetonicum N1-4(HMT) TaxID=931276 RepID=M1LTE6_9CLOT|nr:immunoglobulin-like domain-containing protein [Clostridium saccharoperbutylacetonicum]AGF56280.1 hypothetical protein Cspa_c25150 [Clostridium saccharoperbutylacetonicum N1-4(HMT)]NRT62977.1 hypothetical protein [Clostridium saccharoperbutylacetonicum]NSB26334.1 hypothetical protein [Clostridium saccharoperbutylacetonicum]NSB45686.1 hypothetical protein [Clostridium saccharoperbutylacetonicum]